MLKIREHTIKLRKSKQSEERGHLQREHTQKYVSNTRSKAVRDAAMRSLDEV